MSWLRRAWHRALGHWVARSVCVTCAVRRRESRLELGRLMRGQR